VALAEIDRLTALGLRFGCALADAGYGASALFRQAPSARGLHWAVGIPRVQEACGTEVAPLWPRACSPARSGGRSSGAGARRGRSPPSPRRRACGWPTARRSAPARTCPARRCGWSAGERRASGEVKCHLSNLPADASIERLAGLIKARRVCGQAHRQMKEELGLGHFEGRSWHGLHHHALMVMAAFAFLRHLRLAGHRRRTGPGKDAAPRSGAATIAEPARRARGPRRAPARAA
jgi:SRSO17 transposase